MSALLCAFGNSPSMLSMCARPGIYKGCEPVKVEELGRGGGLLPDPLPSVQLNVSPARCAPLFFGLISVRSAEFLLSPNVAPKKWSLDPSPLGTPPWVDGKTPKPACRFCVSRLGRNGPLLPTFYDMQAAPRGAERPSVASQSAANKLRISPGRACAPKGLLFEGIGGWFWLVLAVSLHRHWNI